MENKQKTDSIIKFIDTPIVVNLSNFKIKQGVSSSVDWTISSQNGGNSIPNRPHGDDYLPKEIKD